ncbi:Putative L,D-transpeptidase YkuD [Gimesia alba]|uniref:L,D-transpeptidase YkuD n=1 Tax=Gimesia alba TaxID=2527973 RepID=A0A517R8T5_9PLAN|nr:L,D-transpeptidase family protein [Gimesia alba]QDT40268.1 Putative L,D-transpeptidase YkuD [Gimesia alba]
MRYRKQSRLITPFRLIIIAVLGVLGTAAWKNEWIPLQLGSAPTGALNESTQEAASATGRNQTASEYVEPVLEQETIIAQSEPPAEELTDGSDNQRSYQSRDIEIPRIYKRTLTGGIVEADTKIDSPVHEAMEPRQFKGAAQPLVGRQKPAGSQQQADRNAPKQLNPPEGIKRASAPVIKTAKHASYKEEIGSDPSQETTPDLIAIDQLIQQRKIIEAHKKLSKIYWDQPDLYPVIKSRIEETARIIYFSPQPHFMTPYEIEPGDQLRKVATQYKITWEYLAKLNRIDPKRIRPGQKLKVIKGPFAAFVDLSEFTLTIHAHGYFVKRYAIGTGKDHSTPTGKFQVKEKLVDPTYYGPDGVIANDDPTNPLGERWIDIGDSYGIHGTIDPASIGKAESKGCVRMLNEHVAEVYDLLGVGSEVVIRP